MQYESIRKSGFEGEGKEEEKGRAWRVFRAESTGRGEGERLTQLERAVFDPPPPEGGGGTGLTFFFLLFLNSYLETTLGIDSEERHFSKGFRMNIGVFFVEFDAPTTDPTAKAVHCCSPLD